MFTSRKLAQSTQWCLSASVAALLVACAGTPEPNAPAPMPAPEPMAASASAPQPQAQPVADPRAQFKQLSESLGGLSVAVEETADGSIRISVPSDLSFELGKADVQVAMGPVLNQIAASLNRFPATRAEIVGHTDSSGRAASNLALSVKRAESTRDELVQRQVASDRLSVKGLGQDEPVADNKTRQGRAANRRVEIFVFKP